MRDDVRGPRRLRARAAGLVLALAAVAAPTMPVLADPHEETKVKAKAAPTIEEARSFVEEAEKRLLQLNIEAARASWVQSTYITHDTEVLAAEANERAFSAGAELAKAATRFDDLELPADLRRKLELLKRALVVPVPADPQKAAELTRLTAAMESTYGKGEYCPPGTSGEGCLDLQELEELLRTSRDPKAMQEAWVGWRTISAPMRDEFQRYVELGNEGARELGYKDVGALWRSKYDMPPDAFAAEVDRLWGQVKPLYDALHCHVRARLNEKYGDQVVPLDRPIPAHLLGNMWAQSWINVYDLVAPGAADPGYDLTKQLVAEGLDAREMVRYGERFFTSLGFAPLPETFWDRSLFEQPEDREVVCHASAWSIDYRNDLRLKMCIDITGEEFSVVHHELGHNFYQRAYNRQPFLFQDSANDGFHEAVGDTIALSVTPEYLKEVGLIDQVPDPSKDVGLLMKMALDKVAFLPFGLLVDQWRWKVFSGEVGPDEYNQAWWELRQKYQGVAAPVARSEQDFDAGAKYHVPASVPYTRYFLAAILQFQLHRALCQTVDSQGPLHRCSIYGNQQAGQKLQALLAMGQSRPWPDALEAVSGQRQMDATAIIDYFQPLMAWLEQQNQGRKCGW